MSCRYETKYCRFLRQDVWAILAQQPDGTWRVVNCLDKHARCFETDCVLTSDTDEGRWPFEVAADSGRAE